MKRSTSPHARRRLPWPGLALAALPVVLGHVWLLDSLYGLRQPRSLLAQMAAPVYTRVLAQSEVQQTPALPAQIAQASSSRMQTRTITAPPAVPAPQAAPAPSPQESEATPAQAAASAPDSATERQDKRQGAPKRSQHARLRSQPAHAHEPQPDAQPTPDSPPDPIQPDLDSPGSAAHAAHNGASQASNALPPASQQEANDTANTDVNTADATTTKAPDTAASSPASSPASATASTLSTAPASAPHAPSGDNAALAANAWPPNTRLRYRLSGNYRGELHGSASVLWQKTGNQYQAQVNLDLGLLASMHLTSQGEITTHSLVPRVYEELLRKKRRNIRMGSESLHLANGDTVPRPAGVQDTASQFVELSHRFASGQVPLAVGQSVSFALARPSRVAHWRYDVVAQTTLHLPQLGPTRALQVKPSPLDNESAQGDSAQVSAQMWLAPSLQYLPVRIVLTLDKGQAEVDLMLEQIDQDGEPKNQ